MSANIFNSLLYILSIVFYMGIVVFMYKKFGKTGLFVWSAVSVIVANIEAVKMVQMFGMNCGLGNAVYASSFLVTDILSEKYGKKSATKAVNIGLVCTIAWVLITQQMLWFVPNELDFITPSMNELFAVSPIFALTGIFTYAVVQRMDVHLYEVWWKLSDKIFKDHKKGLWIRNNGSTLISQLIDTIVFTSIVACFGIYPWSAVPEMCIMTYILKATANVLDTPFIYWARKIKPKNDL